MNNFNIESSGVRDLVEHYSHNFNHSKYVYWQGYLDIPLQEGDEYLDPNNMTATRVSTWAPTQRSHWGLKTFNISSSTLFRRRKGLKNVYGCKNFRYQTA